MTLEEDALSRTKELKNLCKKHQLPMEFACFIDRDNRWKFRRIEYVTMRACAYGCGYKVWFSYEDPSTRLDASKDDARPNLIDVKGEFVSIESQVKAFYKLVYPSMLEVLVPEKSSDPLPISINVSTALSTPGSILTESEILVVVEGLETTTVGHDLGGLPDEITPDRETTLRIEDVTGWSIAFRNIGFSQQTAKYRIKRRNRQPLINTNTITSNKYARVVDISLEPGAEETITLELEAAQIMFTADRPTGIVGYVLNNTQIVFENNSSKPQMARFNILAIPEFRQTTDSDFPNTAMEFTKKKEEITKLKEDCQNFLRKLTGKVNRKIDGGE